MKRINIFLLSFLFIGLLNNNAFTQIDDTKAQTMLDAVSAKMKGYSTMKIAFTYTIINTKSNINESKSGTIQVKGSKYHLDIGSQKVFCNGTTVWTYLKDENEVNINSVSTQDDAVNPTTILNNYKANFKAKFIKEVVEGGKTLMVIDLTPIKGKSYFKVRLNIDKTAKEIVSSIIYDKNSTTYTYKINSLTSNVTLSDDLFTFNKTKYPGVEENDMR